MEDCDTQWLVGGGIGGSTEGSFHTLPGRGVS
jgi:hypothetical protein